MNKPFQRKGSKSNTHVGSEFEKLACAFFKTRGLLLEKNISVDIGINGKKAHSFDLGNREKKILVECKSHTWTEGGNVPSAKITTWDQAMYYFHATPPGYQKIFFVLRSFSPKRNETLAEYYLRTKSHLIPADVEIWEFDEDTAKGNRIK